MAKSDKKGILQGQSILAQAIRFLVVGTGNTAFSFGLYTLSLFLGLPFYLANLVAVVCGVLFSFVTQGKLVFQAKLRGKFLRYLALWTGLYAVSLSIIWMLNQLGLNFYWAGLLAIIPVTLLSFLVQRKFIYTS